MTAVALSAYLQRLAFTGPTPPTLATLHALCAAHVERIPFENLDVLLGRPIGLNDNEVDDKLLVRGRGGYCFEHNTLFHRVLVALGFNATLISARVRLDRPRDFTPPRTHTFVLLHLEGERWLADVGVGGLSPTAALRLDTDAEQQTPHEPRRIVKEDGRYFHQARLGDEWRDVCEFTLEAMPPIDREVANWFTSAHPNSHFRNRLLAARALPNGGRLTLLNRRLTTRTHEGTTVRELQTPTELLTVLADGFGLHFEPGTRFSCAALDWPSAL